MGIVIKQIHKQMKIKVIIGGFVYLITIVLFMYFFAGVKDISRLLITASIASLLFIVFSHYINRNRRP